MEVYHDGNTIYFKDERISRLGMTEYNKGLWELIDSTKWHPSGNYIRSSKLGYLHRVVMSYWYGEDAITEAKEKDFIVEHLDNNGVNCSLKNLCFAYQPRNRAKGQVYDILRKEMEPIIALNIFKDFKTQKFQITVGLNQQSAIKTGNDYIDITAIYLLYDNDFVRTLLDAEKILHEVQHYNEIDMKKLSFVKMSYQPTSYIEKLPGEEDAYIFERNGNHYINLDDDRIRLSQVAPNLNLYSDNKD